LAGQCGDAKFEGTMTDDKSAQSPSIFTADARTAVVRYQVRDVDRAVAFYTEHLGFELVQRPAPVLAIVSRGALHLLLSGAQASGSRAMPDGQRQEPGGWNRVVLYVNDLDSTIAALETARVRFRNEVEVGPGGRQILLDDPEGNPIELHEAPKGA
jgi:glyoxylase I family protein